MVMVGELLDSMLEPTSKESDTVSEWLESSSIEGDNLQCAITVNTTLISHGGYRAAL